MAFNPNARLDPSQVEDRRGGRMGTGTMVAGGGGISLIVALVAMLLGINPFDAGVQPTPYDQPEVAGQQAQQAIPSIQECRTGADANQRADCRIVGFVDSIQQFWSQEFARNGRQYAPARTVLFSGATQAGCGFATAASGPFYCPQDSRIYLDLSFFQQLREQFGAQGGPFAEGYVVAHEYGHHVQRQLGLLPEGGAQNSGPQSAAVRIELMADCLAGVWAHHASATGYLQPPTREDLVAALDAAAAVGDDRIQSQTRGRVNPESWTHGSSEQRQQWFITGYNSGDTNTCNTLRGQL